MNMPNRSGYQAYQKSKYETASPHKLISLLYNAAVSNIQRAAKALDEGKYADANQFNLKAQDILYELLSCLNEEQGGEIAANLKEIYLYCVNQLVRANIRKDKSVLLEVERHVDNLRQAWLEIGKDVGVGAQS